MSDAVDFQAQKGRTTPFQSSVAPGQLWPPRLTAEQRRALAILATSGRDGATQSPLSAHGFSVSMIAGLVNRGLATLTREQVRAGGKMIEVGRVRITESGRGAVAAED